MNRKGLKSKLASKNTMDTKDFFEIFVPFVANYFFFCAFGCTSTVAHPRNYF